ncbi:MAG: 23S rRNA (uracil(1939)-C(5))-methyltransferase RlmD [Balneolales bacterium]
MSYHQPSSPVKKGRELDLEITSAAFEGKGLGRVGDYAIFVKNTAPGDRVRVRIIRKRKNFAEGLLLEILSPSSERIQPKCRHAEVCGGCTWQHIPYDRELVYKTSHVTDHFQRIGGFREFQAEPVIGAPEPFYYRNKMEYTFGARRWLSENEVQSREIVRDKHFALGLHVPGRYDRILNLEECYLQDPVSFRILDAVRNYALKYKIEPYNTHHHSGFLRHLVIRNAVHTQDLMVNLVTRKYDESIIQPLMSYLIENFPEITTIVNNINDTRSPTSQGRYQKILHGPGYIREYIGKYVFRIDTDTFFQTNSHQAEALFKVVYQAFDNQPVNTVYDLYSGIGTLALYVSDMAAKIVAIELSTAAMEKAKENAAENGVKHVFFEQGDMKDTFNDAIIAKYGKPDIIITDPPRAGMHDDVIERIKNMAPGRIIYISCNSATQARDVAALADVYNLKRVQPVDMFPRTYHIESVAVLDRKE